VRDPFTEFERDGWSRAADGYARAYGPMTAQAIPWLLDDAGVGRGTRLLDLACGPGLLGEAALGRGAIVTCADLVMPMLELARHRVRRADYCIADAQALPFADASFDAVTLAFLVGHLANPLQALSEARRVLAPDRRVAFAWWRELEHTAAFRLVRSAVERLGRTDVPIPAGPSFDQFSDPAIGESALLDLAFTDVRVHEAKLSWKTGSAQKMFDACLEGSVRTAALLRAQEPAALAAIREDVIEAAKAYADERGVLDLPMPAWIVSGAKP